MLKTHCVIASLGMILFTGLTSQAGISTATFDFENQPVSGPANLTSLSIEDNGLTATFDRMGQPFAIADISALANSAPFGQRSLSPTPPGGNAFDVSFSQPVSMFSVEFGDSTASTTNTLNVVAFSGLHGTGSQITSTTGSMQLNPNGAMAFQTLQVSGNGIKSVEFIGGTPDAPNSVYYDNLHVSGFTGATTGGNAGGGAAVPLPPAIFIMPFCGVLIWLGTRMLRTPAVR